MNRAIFLWLLLGVTAAWGGGSPGLSPAGTSDTLIVEVPETGTLVEEATRWSRFLEEDLSEDGAAAVQIEKYRQDHGILLGFWAGRQYEKKKIEAIVDHEPPCGPVTLAFFKTMPGPDLAGTFVAEIVQEIDEEGNEIQAWRAPYQFYVVGVRGDELIIRLLWLPYFGEVQSDDKESRVMWYVGSYDADVQLAIRPDGSFRVTAPLDNPPPEERIPCPEVPALTGSSYRGCMIFRDLASGEARRVTYQRPCT